MKTFIARTCMKFWLLSVFITIMTCSITFAEGNEKTPVKIGVLANRGIENCLENWSPTADYLSSKVPGMSFVIVPLSFYEIYEAVEKGKVDFILANSSFYVEVEQWYGANRIATLKNRRFNDVRTTFGGVIFCKADRTDMRDLKDLKGKTFMAVEETSFGGWRMAWRELIGNGIDPSHDFKTLSFGGSHDRVVNAVKEGSVDAGTVRTDTLERMQAEGKIRMQDFHVINANAYKDADFPYLLSTRIYPEWPMAKVKHTSDELAKKVAIALLEMPPDSAAAMASKSAGWTNPLNYQSVHECLKELKIGPYQDLGKITLIDVIRNYWRWIVVATGLFIVMLLATIVIWNLNRHLKASQIILSSEIDERKQAETALSERKTHFKAILDSIPVGIVVINEDNHTIADANKSALKLMGVSREQVLGGSCRDYICSLAEGICSMKDHKQQMGFTELLLVNADGGQIPTLKSDIRIEHNNRRYLVVSLIDITERKQAEEQHARLATAIEQSDETIVITNPEGEIQYANPAFARITGFSTESVIGTNPRFLKSGKHDNAFYKAMWDTIRAGRVWKGRLINRKKNGELFEEEATISAVRDRSGSIINFVAVKRDVTSEVIMQRQLAEARKLESIGQLAAGIAHEINTPTQFIGDNTRFLQESFNDLNQLMMKYQVVVDGAKESGMSAELIRDIETTAEDIDLSYLQKEIPTAISQNLEGIENIARIVRSMKEFAHPGTAEKTPIEINRAIENTIIVAKNEWKYVAEMVTELDPNLPMVPCLPGEFNQVILNMIINAAHAIGDSTAENADELGRITITTKQKGDGVEIRIADTGTGIPVPNRSRIFDPFFTTKEVGKGSGQGLSISHTVIVEKHGGTVDFETETGKGTTFIIRLPIPPESLQEL